MCFDIEKKAPSLRSIKAAHRKVKREFFKAQQARAMLIRLAAEIDIFRDSTNLLREPLTLTEFQRQVRDQRHTQARKLNL